MVLGLAVQPREHTQTSKWMGILIEQNHWEESSESFHLKRSRSRAGTVSNLLRGLIFFLFLWKYMKYYQTGQIGVSLRTDFHQVGTLNMEWTAFHQRHSKAAWFVENVTKEISEFSYLAGVEKLGKNCLAYLASCSTLARSRRFSEILF